MGRTTYDWAGFDHLSWVFDHSSRGSRHLRESEGEFFWQRKVWTHYEFQCHYAMVTIEEGRNGKCEERNEKCEFLARESVNSSPIVRIFGKGRCKLIANFSATMVTSLPSLSLSLFSLSLSLSLSISLSLYLSLTERTSRTIGSASALPIVDWIELWTPVRSLP